MSVPAVAEPSRPSRRRFRAGRLLVLFASGISLSLALAEVAVRVFDPIGISYFRHMSDFQREGLRTSDVPGLFYENKPGVDLDVGVPVRINSLGLRGGEIARPKPAGTWRVVVLGDSIAFGYGVADEQTFTHLLDARDNGIAAANMGVQGFGPGQELLVLQREGLRADPDVVVLAVCLRNDLADAVLPVALYNGINPRPRYRLVADELVLDDAGVRLPAPARAVGWLSDHSHLYNRLSALLAARPEPSEESWRVRKDEALRDSDYAVRLSVKLVLEMQRLCRERGVLLLVATFPGEHAYESEPELHRRFHAALRNAGVRTLALREELRARGLGASDVTLDETGHLAPAGHRATADVLESEIRRSK